MRDRHGADVPPVHEHLLGFRVAPAPPSAAPPRFLTLLRTPQSEALFADERFRKHELVLSGRVLPRSSVLEVSGLQWLRDGKVFDVAYWCEVCAIRGVDPGPCACCQSPLVLREEAARDGAPGALDAPRR